MLKNIRKFIAPPIFEQDEDKTRTVAMLNAILWFLLIGVVIIATSFVISSLLNDEALPDLMLVYVLVVILVGMLGLIRLGFYRITSFLFSFFLAALNNVAVFQSPTADPSIMAGSMISVIVAGLLLGGWGAMTIAVANIFVYSSFGYFYEQGWILFSPLEGPQLITFGTLWVSTALLLGLANRNAREALVRARRNEQELSELAQSLEHRVDERTRALNASFQVSQQLATILDLDQLLVEVVERIQAAFHYYHVHIYTLEESSGDLIMSGGTGEAGRTLLLRGHKVPKGKGLVGRAAGSNQVVLVSNTLQDPDWLPNPLLPDTQSEVAVPIAIGEQVLGVLDVQQNIVDGLKEEDVDLLHAIASQVAIGLRNARSYTEAQQRAERETLANAIRQKIQSTTSVETALQIAAREMGRTLGLKETRVVLDSSGMVSAEN